jgi:aminoglycoside phosphotransferase
MTASSRMASHPTIEGVSAATYISWAAARLNLSDPCVNRARSGDNSTVFEITSGDARWFLKIGDRLARECAGLRWLAGRLPVPQVVAFDQVGATDALLMTAVPGTNLAALAKSRPPAVIAEMLASALRAFHSVSAGDCPFEAYIPGQSLVHGDACLPNIIVGDDGSSGYIDLGDVGVGDVEVDLSAAVWSLRYNLGPGWGRAFLTAYGRPDATDQDVDRLWAMYATRVE